MFRRYSILGISLMVLVITACRQTHSTADGTHDTGNTTVIEGRLEGGEGREVILEELDARELIPIDTVECGQEGAFSVGFSPDHIAFYALRTGTPGYLTLLVKPGEKVHFTGTYGDKSQYSVKGSPGSGLLMKLSEEHRRTLDELKLIAQENTRLMGTDQYASLKPELDRRFDSVSAAFRSYSLNFIRENQESLAILIALYNMYGQGLYVFDPVEYPEVYEFVDSVLHPRYTGYEMVDLLHAQVAEARASSSSVPGQTGLPLGMIAPDFVSSQPDGASVALSDFRGNYLLLSFWAGWSSPSREENGVLRMAWDRYGKKQFRILQVSFDDNRQTWMSAIAQDGLEWPQVSDLKRWDSPVADLYRVERIPSNFLIGPDGKIVGRDLFGKKLLEQLEQIFKADT